MLVSPAARHYSGYHPAVSDVAYVRTSMTQLNAQEGYKLQLTGVSSHGFTINQKIHAIGPILVFPKTLFSWNVEDADEINEKSLLLFKLMVPKIDVLIIGTGDKYSKARPEVAKWLISNKINNFEILPTEKAMHAFNFLIAEDRFVAAALIPGYVNDESDQSVVRSLERSALYDELPTGTTNDALGGHEQRVPSLKSFMEKNQKDN